MYSRVCLGAAILALAMPGPAATQDWRDMTSFRQRSDESRLDVSVRYGAGRLRIEPGSEAELYRVGLRYDSDLFNPITAYRPGSLEVGVEGTGRNVRLKHQEAGELKLALSPAVPLELELEFGAVEADLEFGGLHVRSVEIHTGASDSKVRFSEPNATECDRFDLRMGAAAFGAMGLGNAGCRRVTVEGGVGDVTLDFSGAWNRDIEAAITMALGSVTLVIPEDVGVRVDKATFLTDFARPGFVKRDDLFYSRNWDQAERKLTVDLRGAFGTVNVRWAAATAVTP